MSIKDLKYLLSYTIPLTTLISLTYQGMWSYFTVVVAFGIIPIIELLSPQSKANLIETEVEVKKNLVFFDILLYVNVLWIYGILAYFIHILMSTTLQTYELVGLILSIGIVLGSNGINVAHELGHKSGKLEQFCAKLLLLPSFYQHFIIEHNYGHHLKVSTPEDPATSRFGENVFAFWYRSISGGLLSAWKIEKMRLHRLGIASFSWSNQLLRFALYQCLYVVILWFYFSPMVCMALIVSGFIGILLLESINYIEHYGLLRKQLVNGRYETVASHHSWNSNHEVGRILLYELTRHSDHHYKANKKYQILRHHDESPQLPYGYPTSILIALVPTLWFKIMNPKVATWRAIYLT